MISRVFARSLAAVALATSLGFLACIVAGAVSAEPWPGLTARACPGPTVADALAAGKGRVAPLPQAVHDRLAAGKAQIPFVPPTDQAIAVPISAREALVLFARNGCVVAWTRGDLRTLNVTERAKTEELAR